VRRRLGASGILFASLTAVLMLTQMPRAADVGTEVVIDSPTRGDTVRGTKVNIRVTVGPDVSSARLSVDGGTDFSTGDNLEWNSTTAANGKHTLTVRVFQQGGTAPIGQASGSVVVQNSPQNSAAQPPRYFATLPASAPLPTGSQCAEMIAATPETVPANEPFNHAIPRASQLSAYAANGYTSTYQDDYTQYKRVNGHYSGSTGMIMRWAACKYGIGENVVRAQAWVESHWYQAEVGDMRGARSRCIQGVFSRLWNTTIVMSDGSTISCPKCYYQSWSAWQTKVFYEWMTWPEIMQSTAFAADYRYADQRACMNGAYASYFSSATKQPNTYSADVANYVASPTTPNTRRVLWGCIGMHFSGNWFDNAARLYIAEVKNALATQP
jgi:Big-like domain-containing protein